MVLTRGVDIDRLRPPARRSCARSLIIQRLLVNRGASSRRRCLPCPLQLTCTTSSDICGFECPDGVPAYGYHPPQCCQSPDVVHPNGTCGPTGCNEDQVWQSGGCVCAPPMLPWRDGCLCPGGALWSTTDKTCVCPAYYSLQNGACALPSCTAGELPAPDGTCVVCSAPQIQENGLCLPPYPDCAPGLNYYDCTCRSPPYQPETHVVNGMYYCS